MTTVKLVSVGIHPKYRTQVELLKRQAFVWVHVEYSYNNASEISPLNWMLKRQGEGTDWIHMVQGRD